MEKLTKKYVIHASAEKVFEALTEPFNIKQWSGDEVIMNNKRGGEFSLWSGSIHGKNIEISPNKIVQKWKEKNWENFSSVTFDLTEENGQTILKLTHIDIPDQALRSINDGWDRYYLGPLKTLLES